MSENIIKIIPKQVGAIPVTTRDAVAKYLKDLGIVYQKLDLKVLDNISLIDCGKNLEYIRCPYCHAEALKWWGHVMVQAEGNGFRHRNLVTPCCQRGVMLEDLDYCLDMGFAKFVIEITESETILTNRDLYELGVELGCELKKINARY